jgi:hypothetical protein
MQHAPPRNQVVQTSKFKIFLKRIWNALHTQLIEPRIDVPQAVVPINVGRILVFHFLQWIPILRPTLISDTSSRALSTMDPNIKVHTTSDPLQTLYPLSIENNMIRDNPFLAGITKHYLNIFTKHQFNGGIARRVFYFLPSYEHAFHIQFIWLKKRKKLNQYNKIKTKFIYHWCTQKSLYTNVHSISEYCVHRTSKPMALTLRILGRTPQVRSPEGGKFCLSTSEDVAQWRSLLCTMDFNENWW